MTAGEAPASRPARILWAVCLFLTIVAFANLCVWTGAWAIHNLVLGLDALVLLGTPISLFVVPGIVMRLVVKAREKRAAVKGKSLLAMTSTAFFIFGVLCPFMLLFVCTGAGEWIQLRTGKAAEAVPVEQVHQHRDAVYLSVAGAQVLVDIQGSERISTGRNSWHTYYASPVVPRAASSAPATKGPAPDGVKAALAQHQPFELWLSSDSKSALAAIRPGQIFGGTVLHGGDSQESIAKAVSAHRLQPVKRPLIIDLGPATHDGALDEVWLWAFIAIGLYNLVVVGFAGQYCFLRITPSSPKGSGGGRIA